MAALALFMAAAHPCADADAASKPMSAARAAIAAAQKVAPGGINELKTVRLGGIDQWISVRGNDPANPILLFIHGGPGAAMMAESWTYERPWEDFFTVVQWDQRNAGKTFSSAKRIPDKSLSIERLQADGEELIALLRQTYGKDKIFLMGHSFGSILGARIAQHHPEWLYAYIGVGQVVNGERNEEIGYKETLAEAERVGNQQAIKELKAIAPYPAADGTVSPAKTIAERKWDVALGGMIYGQSDDDESLRRSMSPLYSDYDVQSAELGEEYSFNTLWHATTSTDLQNITQFKCPVFIFSGAHDRTTPTTLAEAWFSRIQAPTKRLFKIERAAHYVVSEAPGEVLVDLVEHVRPLAVPQRDH
jgi:pimeloyl-ACP methyl ester carboxylesterase